MHRGVYFVYFVVRRNCFDSEDGICGYAKYGKVVTQAVASAYIIYFARYHVEKKKDCIILLKMFNFPLFIEFIGTIAAT